MCRKQMNTGEQLYLIQVRNRTVYTNWYRKQVTVVQASLLIINAFYNLLYLSVISFDNIPDFYHVPE